MRVTPVACRVLAVILLCGSSVFGITIHVSPTGSDTQPGTADQPLQSVAAAQSAARAALAANQPVTVVLHGGTYDLPSPLILTQKDSGTSAAPMKYVAAPGEQAVITGSVQLHLQWSAYKNSIMMAQVPPDVPITAIDQLFVDGRPMILARYPNYDSNQRILNGYAADAISPQRASHWTNPTDGFIHAITKNLWGSVGYQITGVDSGGKLTYQGGWQTNRPPAQMHPEYRFVENIFEELDAPEEFFFNPRTRTLFLYPPANVDLPKATIEATRLQALVQFQGSATAPVEHITFQNITFAHAARTFMKTREPLLRSDWAIYRGGAVYFSHAQHCTLQGCTIQNVGGNAVFIDGQNQAITLDTCHITACGASGVCIVGQPSAVRCPMFTYAQSAPADMSLLPGPASPDYPRDCVVQDCLIHDFGQIEKQVAGVEIDIASHVTVNHCSIYDCPRAGINIGDGCFGGHIIEGCDVFNTVQETGDHGSFNAWGRDRFWNHDRQTINAAVARDPSLPTLDALEPNILRDSRWRCDHGWDIDLDDGAGNYQIFNNVCLAGGIKLREGYHRNVRNNVLINSTFHAHVWLQHSGDVFAGNIVCHAYRPIGMPKAGSDWGDRVDSNFFTNDAALAVAQKLGVDAHSVAGKAQFVDPAAGDFQVAAGSPALAVGFNNFDMQHFGVTDPTLRRLAKTPTIPQLQDANSSLASDGGDPSTTWLGAKAKMVTSDEEISATGMGGRTGAILVDVPADSAAARFGLQKMDVVIQINGKDVRDLRALANPGARIAEVFRNQAEMKLVISG